MEEPVEQTLLLSEIERPERPHRETVDADELQRLADSIARNGLLQPIGVARPTPTEPYRIGFGDRRFLAHRLLGRGDILARVWPVGTSLVEIRIAENSVRADLNPLEEARYCRELLDTGRTVADVAGMVRHSHEWVTGRLALLDYTDDLRVAITRDGLPLAVARELATVDYEPYRTELIGEALRNGATGRTATAWVAGYHADRARIVTNTITRDEILRRREELRVLVLCEWCRHEIPVDETRIFRLCADDARGFLEAAKDEAASRAAAEREGAVPAK